MYKCFIFLTSVAYVCGCMQNPTVLTRKGFIRGKCVSKENGYFYSFTSIPYAEPPVGHLRFKPPQPIPSWNNILDATTSHSVCPQYDLFGTGKVLGNEDCLYLNVYTPQVNQSQRLTVMIYIHGGAFEIGNGNQFNPIAFLNENVVLVIPNYRLGALGFLSTGDEVVPGNNGLKDQNCVLRWVKSNIRSFGGNPNKITVFGQSAGGSSAHYHMLSPLSKDLISAVISQSGVSASIWAFDYENNVPNNSKSLAKQCNCSTENNRDMIECLRNVPAYEIVTKQIILPTWTPSRMTPFRPVIEPKLPGAFISKHPFNIIKSNRAAKIPFMTGITTEDGAMLSPRIFTNNNSIRAFNNHFDTTVSNQLDYINNPYKKFITKSVKKYYYNNEPIIDSDRSRSNATNMYTDRMFLYSQNKIIQLHLDYTNEPVYNYAFGFRGSTSLSALFGDPNHDYGTAHADDTLYLFPSPQLNEAERLVSKLLVRLWVNFATYGDPTPRCVSSSTCWNTVQSDNIEYFLIKSFNDTGMLDKLYEERMQFWKNMPLGIDYL